MVRIQIDSLVRGKLGATDKVDTIRVVHVGPSTLSGFNADGQQRQIYTENAEVIGDPRPLIARTDIPKRFR